MSDITDDEAWNAHLKEQGIELSGLTPLKVHQLLAYQQSFLAGRRSVVTVQPDRVALAAAINEAKHPLSCTVWMRGGGCSCGAQADAVIAALSAPTPEGVDQ